MAGNIIIVIFLVWICIYSFSFGVYTWKNSNWFGGLIVILLSLTSLLLPAAMMFL
ncbi:hypothetical protein [Ruminiclostridium papyrosolvens]|uniref:Uncharacterized protein n=1 Tax=Ruminiclostridium papyrosolvens C7 TaxID=1330534 RepID=U4QYS7_9FIRM|nr:hypothetical protein [Ruminiclostridium papyrosolvens]EPR08303.1 hypothetical protein L323_18160 [Ruminiclostridium papyrosolvens C7]